MKKHRFALLGMLTALISTSCVVNPYQTGHIQSSGFGMGHGYGSRNFSSSVFVSTGNPRWAYDPYAGAYFDHSRRCYYDPHLCGYYPMGFRPSFVHGAPHPRGWRPGNSYCAPPNIIRSTTLSISHSRSRQYRSLGNHWSRNVRDHNPHYQHQDHGHRSHAPQQMPQQVPQQTQLSVSAPTSTIANENLNNQAPDTSPPSNPAPSSVESVPETQAPQSSPSPEPEPSPIGLGESQ
jgi:hypothetical protein